MDERNRIPPAFALAGALQPIWFLGGSVVFGLARPGYDATHAISELGQQGSTNAVAWNILGFGGSGILFALFAAALGEVVGRRWLFRLTVAQAVLIMASGAFSCDTGCPPMMSSWQGWSHTIAGLSYFAVTSVVPIVAWRTFRNRSVWRGLATISLVVGVVVVGLFAAGPFVFGADRIGWYQRLTLGTVGVWAILVSVRLYRLVARRPERTRPEDTKPSPLRV